jgi:hypothetical protein
MDILHSPLHIFRRKFTSNEDAQLKAVVMKCGTADWVAVASQMPHRDCRQCRERWYHYLAPELLSDEWTKEEDVLLAKQVEAHGHKWKWFEMQFPGRTDINIKNRYQLLLRRSRKELHIALGIPLRLSPRKGNLWTGLQCEESQFANPLVLMECMDSGEWAEFDMGEWTEQ